MKPILFLDINGVLNSIRWFKKQGGITRQLDSKCVYNLQQIVAATDCSIVIMSTWRLHTPRLGIMQALCNAGYIPPVPIVGETPSLSGRIRGHEVKAWLFDTYGTTDVTHCCIDDGNSDFCMGQPLVQIDSSVGLSGHDVDKIIDRLTRPPMV